MSDPSDDPADDGIDPFTRELLEREPRDGSASPFIGCIPVYLERIENNLANMRADLPRPKASTCTWWDLGNSLSRKVGAIPGYDRLITICTIETGKLPSSEWVTRFIGRLAERSGKPFRDVTVMSTLEAVELYNACKISDETPAPGTEAPAVAPIDPASAEPPVTLRGEGVSPVVRGTEKPSLSVPRYNVVKALMDAGERGLTGWDLADKSGHGGAVNVLKALAESDPDWRSVILLPGPGGAGKRYRIRRTNVDER